MKKTICVLLVLVMILALGISAMAENGKAAATSDASEATTSPPTSGADDAEEPEWDMSVPTEITEEIQANFDKAMEKLMGVDYTPVAVLGVQGDTCCILCKATVVYPGAQPYNVLVYLRGNEVRNVYELWIDKHADREEPADGTANCA